MSERQCRLWLTPRYWFRRLVKLRATPHDVAMGSSIGVFVAFTPTIGLQMVIAGVLATLMRTSRPAAIIPVWISNPVTMGPIFAITYWVGKLVWPWRMLNGQGEMTEASELMAGGLLMHGVDAMIMMTVGGILTGMICGAGTYPLVKWMTQRYQERGCGRVVQVRA
ncbi:DUF2062 domain-containing protein [Poriferisphaera sp. WC338]|uniref:DUF2062 domain-containing protein n=1 Tax=Poriferisphaera sp. WC338 TaxID=3425129 RepID=UPI003D817E24